jgi:hypothetical protein
MVSRKLPEVFNLKLAFGSLADPSIEGSVAVGLIGTV